LIRKVDGTYIDIPATTNLTSTATSLTQVFTMAELKTVISYVNDTDKGKYINLKVTATNVYTVASTASEANSNSAVYQEWPAVYAGTNIQVSSITTTGATITWNDVTDASLYGYSAITEWKYWYYDSADLQLGVGTSTTRSAAITGLTNGTLYKVKVEPLNVYMTAASLSAPRAGTTA